MKIISIIIKNFKYLLHHKFSTFMIIIGPLLIITFAVFAFNSIELHGITIGIISNDENKMISNNAIIESIENEGFSIKYFEYLENCNKKLKQNLIHLCIEEKRNIIRFHVEPSRLNLVYLILNRLSSKIDSITDEIKYELTSNLFEKIVLIEDYLIYSNDYFDELLEDIDSMEDLFKEIYNEIDLFEIDFNRNNLDFNEIRIANQNNKNLIFDFQEMVIHQLNTNIEKLDKFDSLANEIEKDLKEKKELRENADKELIQAYEHYNCSNANYFDLTEYYNDPYKMLDQINTLEKPECTYIVSVMMAIDQCVGDLEQASSDVQFIRNDIKESKTELNLFKEDSKDVFQNSIEYINYLNSILNSAETEMNILNDSLTEVNKSKINLLNNLNFIETQLNQNQILISDFNEDLKNISLELNEISNLSSTQLLNPIINQIEGFDQSRTNIDYLFPTLIVFIIMFVAILLGNILIIKEKKSRAFFRNIISPSNSLIIPFGAYLTILLIIFFQITIIFVLSMFFLPLSIYIYPFELFITLFIGISIFTFIGIIFGSLIDSEESMIVISILLIIIFLIFSNVLMPIEVIPPLFNLFIQLNPFFIISEMIKKQVINGILLESILKEVVNSVIYLVFLSIIAIVSFLNIKK